MKNKITNNIGILLVRFVIKKERLNTNTYICFYKNAQSLHHFDQLDRMIKDRKCSLRVMRVCPIIKVQSQYHQHLNMIAVCNELEKAENLNYRSFITYTEVSGWP